MSGLVKKHPVISVMILLVISLTVYLGAAVAAVYIGSMRSSMVMSFTVALIAALYIRGSVEFIGKKMDVTFWHVLIGIAAVFMLYVSMALVANLIYTYFGDAFYDAYNAVREESSMTNQVLALLFTVVFAPISEELLFRGAVYGTLRRTRLPLFVSAFISSFVFALAHGTLVHVIPATIMGAFCCMIYECTGQLRWTIVVHAVYNLISYIAAYITVPDWLGGFPAVFLQTVIWVSVVVVGLWWSKRRDLLNEIEEINADTITARDSLKKKF